jgi:hypothetical protein
MDFGGGGLPWAQMAENFKGGANQFASGLFGDSGAPYEKAMGEWQKYMNQGRDVQNPFYQGGVDAIPKYQEWANGMKDPSDFINKLMGQYKESPWAKFQQKQGIRAANAFGSANGLSGSTPLMNQAQQNAENISSQDMQNWLKQVLGINTEYGGAQNNMMKGGQNSADQMSRMLAEFGKMMGEGAWGKERGENMDTANMWSGLLHMFMG